MANKISDININNEVNDEKEEKESKKSKEESLFLKPSNVPVTDIIQTKKSTEVIKVKSDNIQDGMSRPSNDSNKLLSTSNRDSLNSLESLRNYTTTTRASLNKEAIFLKDSNASRLSREKVRISFLLEGGEKEKNSNSLNSKLSNSSSTRRAAGFENKDQGLDAVVENKECEPKEVRKKREVTMKNIPENKKEDVNIIQQELIRQSTASDNYLKKSGSDGRKQYNVPNRCFRNFQQNHSSSLLSSTFRTDTHLYHHKKLLNTYQLDPHSGMKFSPERVLEILNHCIEAAAGNMPVYNANDAAKISLALAGQIRNKVKHEPLDRYRICVEVVVGEKHVQGVHMDARCLLDKDRDSYQVKHFQTSTFFMFAICYGVYKD